MRRLIVLSLGTVLLLGPATGCKRKRKPVSETASKEAPTEPATMLGTADPRSALQLTKGFYEIENGGWRWSSKEFSASLKGPSTGAEKGATLVLKFSVVEDSIAKLGPLTLSAKVAEKACPTRKFDKAGSYEYKCDIPAAAFESGRLVPVDFALDKVLPMTDNDQRELGLVVMMVGFEAK